MADETAFFALPEGQRGIYIGGGGSVRIARLLGVGRMTDLMLTGRVLTSAEGERFGIVQYAVPKGKHLERAKSLAARVAENAPMTNWAIIAGLPRIQDFGHEDGLFVEGLLSGMVSTPESGERLKAFLEKRAKPARQAGHLRRWTYGVARISHDQRQCSRLSQDLGKDIRADNPLEGITVIELGQFIAGPMAGQQLADFGARVIKIERPGAGDPFRTYDAAPPYRELRL